MLNIDDKKVIEKYDESGMLTILEAFPEQCRAAKTIGYRMNLPPSLKKGVSNIVCTGMGGSAIGADIIRSYVADESRAPILVNRNYILPGFVGKDTVVIAGSYSGNTEETISAYKDARKKKARIVVITSGGELNILAQRDGCPVVLIPKGLPPRCALGYSFFPILILLSKIGIIKDKSKDIDSAIKTLDYLKLNKIGFTIDSLQNTAKHIARESISRVPAIYASQEHLDSVVTRWRGQFAENSKTLASSHVFPELNHNEIVGWENPAAVLKKFIVIMLRDRDDHPRNKKRMDITLDIFKKEGIKTLEVSSAGTSLLAKIFSLIYIGDFASYYLAILNKTDPTPVDRIGYLKEALKK